MTLRRRFFPSTPVQQAPGQTVQLEVQMRPGGAAAAPAAAPPPEPPGRSAIGLLLADAFSADPGDLNGRAVEQSIVPLAWEGSNALAGPGLLSASGEASDYALAQIGGEPQELVVGGPFVMSWVWTAGDADPRSWVYPLLIYIGNAARFGFFLNPDGGGVMHLHYGDAVPVSYTPGQAYAGSLAVAADGSSVLNFLGEIMRAPAPALEPGAELVLDVQGLYINVQASHRLDALMVTGL